jgi:cytochrome P450
MGVSVQQTLEQRIDALFESKSDAMDQSIELFRDIREAGRVYEHGPMLLLTHYEDVKAVIRDGERLSNQASKEGTRAEAIRARLSDEGKEAFDEVSAFEQNFLSRTDGEQHARMRAIMHRVFTPRRIAALGPAIQGYADQLLAELEPGEVVDMTKFAYELPLMAICNMFGAPREDHALIHEWSMKVARNRGGVEEGPLLESRDAEREFRRYVGELADAHRRNAGSGGELVATLLDATEGERMTDDELAATFVVLLFAGHETTTSLIGGGIYELLRNPDQWQALVDDPSLVPDSIDELLRYVTPVQWLLRFAVEDLEVGGVAVEKGQTLVPLLAAANRDADVFPDPDRLDIRRPDAKQTLAFGFGLHYCLGVSLARLEGEIAFRTLVERFPNMELALDGPAEWSGNAQFRHPGRLPVRLES